MKQIVTINKKSHKSQKSALFNFLKTSYVYAVESSSLYNTNINFSIV